MAGLGRQLPIIITGGYRGHIHECWWQLHRRGRHHGTHDANGVVGHNSDTTARDANKPSGHGVFGGTEVPDGAGVFGAHAGWYRFGRFGSDRRLGWQRNGVGVVGISAPPGAKGGDGVQGITNSEIRNGIYGRNDSSAERNNANPAGNGVFGYSRVPDGAGVMGVSGAGGIGVSGASTGHGVMGKGGSGVTGRGSIIGVWGIGEGSGWAGQFSGPVLVTGSAYFQRDVTVLHPTGECVHAETQSNRWPRSQRSKKIQAPIPPPCYVKHEGGRTAAFFDGNVVVTGDIILQMRTAPKISMSPKRRSQSPVRSW